MKLGGPNKLRRNARLFEVAAMRSCMSAGDVPSTCGDEDRLAAKFLSIIAK